MTRYALILEYDGSEFHGWQKQLGVATIQNSLEHALAKFANHQIDTITAGRTDTGVHALNQVVHFDSDVNRQLLGWINGVNAHLPLGVRVKKSLIVADDFDARFSALSRTYHYYLLVSPNNSTHLNKLAGHYHSPLNFDNMQQAAKLLVGKHDFSSFRAAGCQANTPIRTMYELELENRGNMIRVTLKANAFLHHMVRNIIGALVYVGNGKLSVDSFKQMFEACDRKLAPPTFMANGLYLADVEYPQAITNFDQDVWLYNR